MRVPWVQRLVERAAGFEAREAEAVAGLQTEGRTQKRRIPRVF